MTTGAATFPPKISLAAARVNAGLEQKEAARLLKVTPPTLRKWETGEASPTIAKVEEIESLYQYPRDYIFFGRRSLKVNPEASA
jgi:transcriptional regulator with XRE-family HTH domain